MRNSLPALRRATSLQRAPRPAKSPLPDAFGAALLATLLATSLAPAAHAAPPSEARTTAGTAAPFAGTAPVRIAQAQTPSPLLVTGPVRTAAGTSVGLPVRLRPGPTPAGRYVVVMKAPEWLSFSNGELVGNGIWLLDRDKLADIEMKLAAGARGNHDISVGIGGKTSGIEGITELRIEVGAPGAAAAAAAPAPAPAAVKPAAPQLAQAAPAPAAPPAAGAPAAGAAAGGGSPVTWEALIGGKKPAAAAPAAPAAPTPAAAAPASTKTDAQLIQDAKHLVRECTTCHNLYGQDVGIPVMVGLTVDRFLDTMDLYKRNKRDNQVMQVISKSLSDDETRALALYLSRIKPAAQAEAAPSQGPAMAAGNAAALAQQPMVAATQRIVDDKSRVRVKRWLQRGEEMLNAGDIAQARLLLERATEFGDARAAFLMASSFDPNALPFRPGIGMVAEPLMARRWYLTAKSLGAGAEADNRLAELPAPR